MAEAAPQLEVIDNPIHGWPGTFDEEGAEWLIKRCQELADETRRQAVEIRTAEIHEEKLENDLKGKRLKIAELETDREEKALASPERPQVEAIHRLWKRACSRRRPLHFADRERIGAAVKKLGFTLCVAAVAGAAYDPNFSKPRRNGKREKFDDLELVFREYAKVKQFADRVPDGWEPDAERIAAIADVDVDKVRGWLG